MSGSILEKIVFTIITLGITANTTFQYQLHKDYTELSTLFVSYNSRLERVESDLTVVKSQMVSWDVLKRIELYLSTLNPSDSNQQILKAIRVESASRTKSKK